MLLLIFTGLLAAVSALNGHLQLKALQKRISVLTDDLQDVRFDKKYIINLESNFSIFLSSSSKLPTKKEVTYPVLIRASNILLNIYGEQIFRVQAPHFLISSLRNQPLVLAILNKSHVTVQHLEVSQKILKANDQNSWSCINSHQYYTSFLSSYIKSRRIYVLGTKDGRIQVLKKNGTLEHDIKVSGTPIINLFKYSNQIIYLSQSNLGLVHLISQSQNEQALVVSRCQSPFSSPQYLTMDDSNLNRMFVRAGASLYLYQITPDCRIIGEIGLPSDSKIHNLGDLIVVQHPYGYYYLNISNDFKLGHLRLPIFHNQIHTLKKSEGSYLILGVHINQNRTVLTFYNYGYQEIDNGNFNMRGFKAPIFIVSICIVFYYSYRNRSNTKKEDKVISEDLLKTYQKKL